jgi:hypothetical protein
MVMDILQGADNKLGQFLNQDIYGLANQRNSLRYSLESCPSLVWRNVNKPSLAIKYVGRVQTSAAMLKTFTRQLKSLSLAEGQPEKPLIEGNQTSQLTRL